MVFTGVAAAVEKKLERYANSDIYHIMNAPPKLFKSHFLAHIAHRLALKEH